MNSMRTLGTLCTTLALLASVLLPTPVSANSSCDVTGADPATRTPSDYDHPRQVKWREHAASGIEIRALGATLEMLTPYQHDLGAAGSSVWIGLLQPNDDRYVQAGFRAFNLFDQYYRRFLEWKDDSGSSFERVEYSAPAPNTLHDFQLVYTSGGTAVNFYYDSVLQQPQVPTLGWVANDALIGGETHSRGNQLFGGTWDYEDISAMRYGIGTGAYINYGSSIWTTFSEENSDWLPLPSQFGQFIYQPNQTPYNGSSQMDLFDWDCR